MLKNLIGLIENKNEIYFSDRLYFEFIKNQDDFFKIFNETPFIKKQRSQTAFNNPNLNKGVILWVGNNLENILSKNYSNKEMDQIILLKKSIETTFQGFLNLKYKEKSDSLFFEDWELFNLFNKDQTEGIFPNIINGYNLRDFILSPNFLKKFNFHPNNTFYSKLKKSKLEKYFLTFPENTIIEEVEEITEKKEKIVKIDYNNFNNEQNNENKIQSVYQRWNLSKFKTGETVSDNFLYKYIHRNAITLDSVTKEFIGSDISNNFFNYNGKPTERFIRFFLNNSNEIIKDIYQK